MKIMYNGVFDIGDVEASGSVASQGTVSYIT
jgi:hypothetical protein